MGISRVIRVGMILGITTLFAATLIAPSLSTRSLSSLQSMQSKSIPTIETGSIIKMEWEDDTQMENRIIYNENFWPRGYDDEDKTIASLSDNQNDAGYNTDTGDKVSRSLPLYPGEVSDGAPGRGRTGTLNPDGGDSDDYYIFSVCQGQTIQVSLSSGESYDYDILDIRGDPKGKSYTAMETGDHFLRIFAREGAGEADYTFTVTLSGQNDAGSNRDAGNSITDVIALTPGSYSGYLDMTDQEDWYSFTANAGQGIFITLNAPLKSDVDVHLYNPTGVKVHEAVYYGDDELEYPADVSGTWKIQLDMFPGWDTTKWPEDYYLYGSGAYTLEVSIGGTAQGPPKAVPQPDITPVAQTFIINDDPASNMDEYCYLAAVPAANYMENGKRYVSPIVYQGVDSIPNWFTTVDQTTQYLLDDWNTYLTRHGLEATEYAITGDPIEIAGNIATTKWITSNDAVLTIEGSSYQDEIETVVDKATSLQINTDVIVTPPDQLTELASDVHASPMFIEPKWGAMTVYALGNNVPSVGIITPRYEPATESEWPFPYDAAGDSTNIYFPIALPGMYFPYAGGVTGDWTLQVTKYAGDRYKIPVRTTDCSLNVTVTTTTPSYLEVFLVDPYGNIRRPSIPHWNGGPINPIHVWNGGHWEGVGFEDWRRWEPTLSTVHSVEVHYPMTGKWTAIVVPHYPYGEELTSGTIEYQIRGELRVHNPDRVTAALSAANGAVIASQKHVPLLYVTEDSVPTETTTALTKLGVKNITFVNINNNGQNVKSALGTYTLTDLNTYQKVIDHIKAGTHTENYITITSLASGDGYFAPAAMIAAYHGGPVLSIGEAAETYDLIDKITSWQEYGGDWYHGCRAQGYLPMLTEPFNLLEALKGLPSGEIPSPGFDLKLRWYSGVYEGIHGLIDEYGLDMEGQEAYLFVAPRDTDIRDTVGRAMIGNNSYCGQIPVETPAFSSDIICRDILYPAIIYANPGRDVTTSQIMNYPDGYTWRANDGNGYPNYASREIKQLFSSRGRFYEGHSIWEGLLERYNAGASISYYSGHGTGGSGISAQYRNVNEDFPQAELRYEHLKDFTWWDGWRGYSGYDDPQTKCPRWGGESGYSAAEPNLYDIIHFKWVDQLFGNLHSEMDFWSSCTTGEHFGPIVYLSHGSAMWFGAAGSVYGVHDDLHNTWMFHGVLLEGKGIGESHSKYQWLIDRDFTTCDPTTLYGRSTFFQGGLTNVPVTYGDPTMTVYSPDWTEPTPIIP